MAVRYYWTRLCPPGISKGLVDREFFQPTNGATQGGSTAPSFNFDPSAAIYTYSNIKRLTSFTNSERMQYQQIYNGDNAFYLYNTWLGTGGRQNPVTDYYGRVLQQADLVVQKNFAAEATYPSFVGQFPNYHADNDTRYAIKNATISPYTSLYKSGTFNSDGLEYVSTTVPSTAAISGANPCVGTSSFLHEAGTYEAAIDCWKDAGCGLYIYHSAVDYSKTASFPESQTAASSAYTGTINGVYKKVSGSLIGAHQVPYSWNTKSIYSNYMHPWGMSCGNEAYIDFATTSTLKYFPSQQCAHFVAKASVTANVSADDFNVMNNYMVVCPRLDFRVNYVTDGSWKPICKKIEAADIEQAELNFLIGKYLVWYLPRAEPMIVSEDPQESGWTQTKSEPDYSRVGPCYIARAGDPVIGQSLTTIQYVNTSELSGASSNCISDSNFMYTNGMRVASFASSGGVTLWNTPTTNVYDAFSTTDWLGYFGGANAKAEFTFYTYKMSDGSGGYAYPTQYEMAVVRYKYKKDLRGYQSDGFALNWTTVPIVATGTYVHGVFEYYRLHKLEVTAADLGISNPWDTSYSYGYGFRIKSPNPAVDWTPPSVIFTQNPLMNNRGTLPSTFNIQKFNPINPIGLEAASMSSTSLKGYYRSEVVDTTTKCSDIYVSNAESLGTITHSGSPSANNFQFSLANVKLHFNAYHDAYANKNSSGPDGEHLHKIMVIRKSDGKVYQGGGSYGTGNSLWTYHDSAYINATSIPTYTDSTNSLQYESSFSNVKVFDVRKDSGFYIVLYDLVPTCTLRPRTYGYWVKMVTLRRWDVGMDGSTTEIFNVANDGFID